MLREPRWAGQGAPRGGHRQVAVSPENTTKWSACPKGIPAKSFLFRSTVLMYGYAVSTCQLPPFWFVALVFIGTLLEQPPASLWATLSNSRPGRGDSPQPLSSSGGS